MRNALTPSELAMMRSVFRRHTNVNEVRLFGSRAKGTHTSRSDIDLALFGPLTALEAQAIASELEDLPLPYKYDIQVFESVRSEPLRDHIRRVGLQVYPKFAKEFQTAEGSAAVEELETCYRDLRDGRKDAWSAFRDVSPEDLRALVTLGLQEANGSYKELARSFRVGPEDYRRFMDLLRRRRCVIDYAPFRRMAENPISILDAPTRLH